MPLSNATYSRVRCFTYTPSGGVSVAPRHFFTLYTIVKIYKKNKEKIITKYVKNNHNVIKNYGCFLVSHIKAWTSFFSFHTDIIFLPQKTSFVVAKSFRFYMR